MPFLSGCPSMCPICKEKGEASGGRWPAGLSAPGADADAGGLQAGPGETRCRRHTRRNRFHGGCFAGRQPWEADGPGALTFYTKGQGPRVAVGPATVSPGLRPQPGRLAASPAGQPLKAC